LTNENHWIAKLGSDIDNKIIDKIISSEQVVGTLMTKDGSRVYYKTTGGLYWKVFTNFPPKFFVSGVEGHSSRETKISVENENEALKLLSLLSSSTYWWWYTLTSNLRDLNPSDIMYFYLPRDWSQLNELIEVGNKYIQSLLDNCRWLERNQRSVGLTRVQSFKVSASKSILDEIDAILAGHYGFTEEELDYILNYDIKYRLGLGGVGSDDNE
jgi:hypothetical protein